MVKFKETLSKPTNVDGGSLIPPDSFTKTCNTLIEKYDGKLEPYGGKCLMMFAGGHGLLAQAHAFKAVADAWANGLAGHPIAKCPFGVYTAEVTGDIGAVKDPQFNL